MISVFDRVEYIVENGGKYGLLSFSLFPHDVSKSLHPKMHYNSRLTLSQTTNFGPGQTERVCRRQFEMG